GGGGAGVPRAPARRESREPPRVLPGAARPGGGGRGGVVGEDPREAGVAAEVSFRGSNAANQLKRANALGARFALVVGELELSSGRAKLKELRSGEQHEVDLSRLADEVKRLAQNTPPSAA